MVIIQASISDADSEMEIKKSASWFRGWTLPHWEVVDRYRRLQLTQKSLLAVEKKRHPICMQVRTKKIHNSAVVQLKTTVLSVILICTWNSLSDACIISTLVNFYSSVRLHAARQIQSSLFASCSWIYSQRDLLSEVPPCVSKSFYWGRTSLNHAPVSTSFTCYDLCRAYGGAYVSSLCKQKRLRVWVLFVDRFLVSDRFWTMSPDSKFN